ncbi:MAG: nitroreductase, partial [Alphaproteobacteria bacterium]|nr:nitroreductase [Alphaproteobacteria bacterium]
EAWSIKNRCVSEFISASSDEMLFCGMAIGYADQNDPINTLKSSRGPLNEWAKFV